MALSMQNYFSGKHSPKITVVGDLKSTPLISALPTI